MLKDLAQWCYARETSFSQGDPYWTAFNEGRRDVYLRIVNTMQLSEEEIERIADQSAQEADDG